MPIQNIGNVNFEMRVMIFVELCIMVNETANFERLNIIRPKEHTVSFSLQQLHFCLLAVLIQAKDLSNFPPSNKLKRQA
jgi:hypothetical protein